MLMYEVAVRDEFLEVLGCARRLQAKFASHAQASELLAGCETLTTICSKLTQLLPDEVLANSNLKRHLGWMRRYLSEGKTRECQQDIEDICTGDLPTLEQHFFDWCMKAAHQDKELVEKTRDLVIRQEFDSAIRKAFVILKARLVSTLGGSPALDGADLVNQLFGNKSSRTSFLPEPERQAMRDLLTGIYGVFRNKYGHNDIEAPIYEANAVLSMVNYALKRLDEYAKVIAKCP